VRHHFISSAVGLWFQFKYGLKYWRAGESPDPPLARARIAETANGWVAEEHFISVFHFLRVPGREKYCWRTTREACEEKISEV
jgi:hypothetical protein